MSDEQRRPGGRKGPAPSGFRPQGRVCGVTRLDHSPRYGAAPGRLASTPLWTETRLAGIMQSLLNPGSYRCLSIGERLAASCAKSQALARNSLGESPVQRLNAREKLLGSENPRRYAISLFDIDSRCIYWLASSRRVSSRIFVKLVS